MALDSEIERVRKDKVRWRGLAATLLHRANDDVLSDWELDFLEGILSRERLDELSYRQGESLLVIRDDIQLVSAYRGYSVRSLIRLCYEARLDLDDDEAEAWVQTIHASGRTSVQLKEARRLFGLAKRLGQIED